MRLSGRFLALPLALLAGAAPVPAPGAPDGGAPARPGVIALTIIDAATGKPTPARVQVEDAQGRFHVAEDALPVGGDCEDHPVPAPNLPLAQTLAALHTRVPVSLLRSEEFYSTGQARLTVPPGLYDVLVSKGPE